MPMTTESSSNSPGQAAMPRQTIEGDYLLASLVPSCPDSIIVVDRAGIIKVFNHAAEELTGHNASDMVDKEHILRIYGTTDRAKEVKRGLHSADNGGQGRLTGMETHVMHRDGNLIPIRISAALLVHEGKEVGSVGFFHDLSKRKQMEDRLRELSVTDSLTGLYNRRQFFKVLGQEASRAQRYLRPISLICFDLDGFKPFNDHYGHLEGDDILRFVAKVTLSCLRMADFAFRYGGDEFMLILPETTAEDAFQAAERLRNDFNERWPLKWMAGQAGLGPVTLSLGVAELGPGDSSEYLIKRSDMAMYEAKRAGGDRTIKAMATIGDLS